MASFKEMEDDEGFDSPSISRTCSTQETTSLLTLPGAPSDAATSPDTDTTKEDDQSPSRSPTAITTLAKKGSEASPRGGDKDVSAPSSGVVVDDRPSADCDEGLGPDVTVDGRWSEESDDPSALVATRQQSEQLLAAVVRHTLGKRVCSAGDPVLQTLLLCCAQLQQQHRSALHGLVRTLRTTGGDRLSSFVLVSSELFEGPKRNVTWHRIVALYTFAGLCAKNGEQEEDAISVDASTFVACISDFVSSAVSPFVRSQGGWSALCSVFPPEERESQNSTVWTLLKWGAVTLGAATASRIYYN